MNAWKRYKSINDPDIPGRNPDNPYMGYVYALEYGESVKIGSTMNPKARLKALESTARLYSENKTGSIMISPVHKNFLDNERALHKHFGEQRIDKSERFLITLNDFESGLPELVYEYDTAKEEFKSAELLEMFKGIFKPNEPAQMFFDIIAYNPKQASEFYIMLTGIANIASLREDVEYLCNEVREIIDKENPTKNEMLKAIQLNEIAKDLLEDIKTLTEENASALYDYKEKYYKGFDFDSLEV